MRQAHSMRRSIVLAVGILIAARGAGAQTPVPPAPDRGYAEAIAESAFGNVTSQSFGAEVGVTVRPELQVFGSVGHIRDVATSEISTAAQTIAGALSQLQPAAVSFSVKEPVTFFVGGVRYRIATTSKLKPYVSGGVGVGTVKKDVKFLIGGSDAPATISQFVTLGSDVAGDESTLMFTLGGGAVYPVWHQVIVDLHYQFGHLSSETPISVSRAGLGVGLRF